MKLISNLFALLTTLAIIFCLASAATAQEGQKPMPMPSPAPKPLSAEPPAAPTANPADVA